MSTSEEERVRWVRNAMGILRDVHSVRVYK